jgi:hypothetical protein
MYSRTGLELFLRCAVYEATCKHPALLQKLLLTFVVEVVVVGESNYYYTMHGVDSGPENSKKGKLIPQTTDRVEQYELGIKW